MFRRSRAPAFILRLQTVEEAPMDRRIEDYAVIGNCETMALVSCHGAIEWLCLPRYDSSSCFASLLGTPDNGHWTLCPENGGAATSRRYLGPTLILETRYETRSGAVCVTDFMTRGAQSTEIIRLVKGERGYVDMRTEIKVRYDYGATVPWVQRRSDGRLEFVAGPDRLTLKSSVPLRGQGMASVARFQVKEGEELEFCLSWNPSWRPAPEVYSGRAALHRHESGWRRWAGRYQPQGRYDEAVLRSLITLKGLAHWETGGVVAAATTSLPEKIGGPRNWDYRYCWLRDATFTLYALIGAGFHEEAEAWRDWLLRAVAGSPADLQIMYGLAGERHLDERELPHLEGFAGSRPVRIGNAAAGQLQLDVYGEVVNAFYTARRAGIGRSNASWALETALLEHLEQIWREPDDGIWEVRGGRRHFTHSKVMAWVAFDRGARSVEELGMKGPAARWRAAAEEIKEEVCARGFDETLGAFTQSYGSQAMDASVLFIPLVGFLPPEDPRVRGTIALIEKRLLRDGFVLRYDTSDRHDGLPPGEGAFLACSFWLADNYILQDRCDEAEALFERLLKLRNDVGLLAEEYDPGGRRQVGNFPQAFSHLALVNTARNLAQARAGMRRDPARAPHAPEPPKGPMRA